MTGVTEPRDVPQLCEGWITHRRLRPTPHAFRHPVFYLRIPLSQLDFLTNRWLSKDKFNLLSFMTRDYGPRDGTSLAAWARGILAHHQVWWCDGEIVLQTFPRVLGYVFNPISLWFVHDRDRALRAVICEVSNTFGEQHHYVVSHADSKPILNNDYLLAKKALHVSPFCEVKGHYRFRFAEYHGRWTTTIDYYDGAGAGDPLLLTLITGAPQPLTAARSLSVFVRYPLFTVAVIGRIHWHALRLWLKRVPWFSKPVSARVRRPI